MMRRPTVSANWKMFKTPNESVEFVEKLKKKPLDREMLNLILFAPYTSLFEMGNSINSGSQIYLGAQNLYRIENAFKYHNSYITQKINTSENFSFAYLIDFASEISFFSWFFLS